MRKKATVPLHPPYFAQFVAIPFRSKVINILTQIKSPLVSRKFLATVAGVALSGIAVHYPQYQGAVAAANPLIMAYIGGESAVDIARAIGAAMVAKAPSLSASLGTTVSRVEQIATTAAPLVEQVAPAIAAAVPALAKEAALAEIIAQDVPTVTSAINKVGTLSFVNQNDKPTAPNPGPTP